MANKQGTSHFPLPTAAQATVKGRAPSFISPLSAAVLLSWPGDLCCAARMRAPAVTLVNLSPK